MAKKKNKTEEAEKTIVMANGEEYRVDAEEGKYYICGKTRFRKGNKNIVKVLERG